jgi:DNA invertase Pin-like site-specific DNA recombinase
MPCVSKPQLLNLQKTLKTDAAIGAKFGVTRQAIHQIRILYKVPSVREKNKDRNAKIIRLRKQGIPTVKLCKEFGLAISQIYRILAKGK